MRKCQITILVLILALLCLPVHAYADQIDDQALNEFVDNLAMPDIREIVFSEDFDETGEAKIYFDMLNSDRISSLNPQYAISRVEYTIVCKNRDRSQSFSGDSSPILIDLAKVGSWGRWGIGLRVKVTFAARPERSFTVDRPLFSIYPYYILQDMSNLTPPDPPTQVTAEAGDAQAVVIFLPPAGDGGSEITRYTVTSYPDYVTATGIASPITVTGLKNGVNYTFTVTASNAVGTGESSAPSAAVRPQVPGISVTPMPEPYTLVIRLSVGSSGYTVNGVSFEAEAAPYIDPENGRAMVPVRLIAQSLGAVVEWDNASRTETITLNGTELSIVLNSPLPGDMGKAALVNDRLYVPLRYITDSFGSEAEWDPVERAVIVRKRCGVKRPRLFQSRPFYYVSV
ncbi:MAG: fibronectin type III domain-containing protein [Clostridiales bacterium]|jgi:hypothetical protein|nr:fibronectin type III domain-containing protein [Clostridiales bacterium]